MKNDYVISFVDKIVEEAVRCAACLPDGPICYSSVTGITDLFFSGTSGPYVLDDLWHLSGLERLSINGASGGIGSLEGCVSLREVSLSDMPDLSDLSPLSKCHNLEKVSLASLPAVKDLLPLARCVKFCSLTVKDCDGLDDKGFLPVASCYCLRDFVLEGCSDVSQRARQAVMDELGLR